jgi:sugar phosphate isomerase/epimerase
MNISTSLNVLFGQSYTIDEAIRRCRAAGFASLDFNYWDHQKYVHGLSWQEEEAWARHIRSASEDAGARFTQMHGPVHGRTFSDMVLGLNEESFLVMAERSLRTAAILGMPWVVFHPSHISMGVEAHKKTLEYNVAFYRKLFPIMEQTGVGIALENMYDRTPGHTGAYRRSYCAMPEELVELIDTLDHPLVGACWDTGHANEQGLDQNAIRQLGSRLKATHINDNDGIKDQHLLPYQGTVDWVTVVTALYDIRYEGDFTYETHTSIRTLPDGLRDSGLQYAAALGSFLVARKGEQA